VFALVDPNLNCGTPVCFTFIWLFYIFLSVSYFFCCSILYITSFLFFYNLYSTNIAYIKPGVFNGQRSHFVNDEKPIFTKSRWFSRIYTWKLYLFLEHQYQPVPSFLLTAAILLYPYLQLKYSLCTSDRNQHVQMLFNGNRFRLCLKNVWIAQKQEQR